MELDFKDKTAVVTGGTRGIGRSISEQLIKSGCRVIYTGTSETHENSIEKGEYYKLQLENEESIKFFIDQVIEKLPLIDILINNAGVNFIESIDEIKDDHWDTIISVNLTAAMKITRAVVKIIKKNNHGGKILNISSIFGIITKEKRASYSASKFGLIGFTKSISLDLASDNILVNALCPGFTLTDMVKSLLSDQEISKLAQDIPLQRFAYISEIANIALFLCSDLNTYITGQTIIADGGFSIK